MNERIRELADEAGIAVWGDAVYMYHPGNTLDSTVMTKFAELIVRECARVAIKKQTENDMDNIVSKNPAKDFAYALIEHFEIK